jgi:hypothetical protein
LLGNPQETNLAKWRIGWRPPASSVLRDRSRDTLLPVTNLRIAFSPDSDDLFMFWPLLRGKIPAPGFTFEPTRADTETLNRQAVAGDLDVVAISIASYPLVADRYLLLPHGGSVGRGYGPVLIANDPCELASLAGKRIAVPGLGTTPFRRCARAKWTRPSSSTKAGSPTSRKGSSASSTSAAGGAI